MYRVDRDASLYEGLNPAQREAVMHGEGPLLVLAGPGSGKTHTICARIHFLIEERKVPPERILVLTFTKAAALSMQQRFYQLSSHRQPVNFGTFHSFFYHILLKYHNFHAENILSENHKRQLLIPILKKHFPDESIEAVPNWIAAISFLKNTGDTAGALKKLPDVERSIFEEVFGTYERRRKQTGGLDFDDMVYECRLLLQARQELRELLEKQYTHILIDEFQDINPVQYETLKLIAARTGQIFAVGDDDQAIYGFRGSAPDCIRRFLEEFAAEQITLRINYRSGQEIIRAAAGVIRANRSRVGKPMQESSMPEEKGRVELLRFEGRREEYTYLTEALRHKREETCGVLFRTNTYMQGFAARLAREGVPFTMKGGGRGIYAHFIAEDIMTYLQLAGGRGGRAAWLQIVNKPYRGVSREALGSEDAGMEAMLTYYRGIPKMYGGGTLRELEKLRRQLGQIANMPPHLAVRYVCKVTGYAKYLRERAGADEEKRMEWEWICDWLEEDAQDFATVEEWRAAQEESRDDNAPGEHAIRLMTAHGSKGLEFDHVWIPDCNEKVFPHGEMSEEAACEEERRLFYVAMTRAKKSLELLCLTGTGEHPRLPSRFLESIPCVRETGSPHTARQTRSCPDTHQKHPRSAHTPHHPR